MDWLRRRKRSRSDRKRWQRKGLGGWRRRMYPEGRECKILQPRGTHGDVISTTKLETYYNPAVLQPRSHAVPMYEWPILLGLSLGKTLSISITASRPSHFPRPLAPPLTRGDEHQRRVLLLLFHLPIYTVGYAEQRFHSSPMPDAPRRR